MITAYLVLLGLDLQKNAAESNVDSSERRGMQPGKKGENPEVEVKTRE
jgi:hypothetical protein